MLIIYLWTALIAFGGVGLTIGSGPQLVLAVMAATACLGLLVVQAPRLAGLRVRRARAGAGTKPGP